MRLIISPRLRAVMRAANYAPRKMSILMDYDVPFIESSSSNAGTLIWWQRPSRVDQLGPRMKWKSAVILS